MTYDNGYTSLIRDIVLSYNNILRYTVYMTADMWITKKIGQNNYTSLFHGVI